MKVRFRVWASGLAIAAARLAASCGTAIVGLGNSGNRISEGGMLDEVAEALADYEGTPQVSDALLGQIFAAVVGRATEGDPEAALIVLRVAERQRRVEQE